MCDNEETKDLWIGFACAIVLSVFVAYIVFSGQPVTEPQPQIQINVQPTATPDPFNISKTTVSRSVPDTVNDMNEAERLLNQMSNAKP